LEKISKMAQVSITPEQQARLQVSKVSHSAYP